MTTTTTTPPKGTERIHLMRWATPRLLRYFKSVRQKMINYRSVVCNHDSQNVTMEEIATEREMEIYKHMTDELNYIKNILDSRENVEKA